MLLLSSRRHKHASLLHAFPCVTAVALSRTGHAPDLHHVLYLSRPQTVRTVTLPRENVPGDVEGGHGFSRPPAPPPPTCHPGVVGSFTALSVVVTLAEALVDCILGGERRDVPLMLVSVCLDSDQANGWACAV